MSETEAGRNAYKQALTDPEVTGETQPQGRHQMAVSRAATQALELSRTPKLFEAVWPRKWLDSPGYDDKGTDYPMGHVIEPSPDEAIAIINGVIDGQLDDALSQTALHMDRRTPARS